MYAPEIRIHSEEKYKPSSVEWYLQQCELFFSPPDGKRIYNISIYETVPDYSLVSHIRLLSYYKNPSDIKQKLTYKVEK